MAYQTIYPYTEEVLAKFDSISDAELDEKIALSEQAFKVWSQKSVADRTKVLANAAKILRENKRDYAEILTKEMGKLISEAESEVNICIGMLEYYVENTEKFLEVEELDLPITGKKGNEVKILRQPLGVLLAVEPWNFPFYQVIRIAAPQLAAGNTIVLKHASINPQSALAMEKLFLEAGAPEGTLVNLFISHNQIENILANPKVKGAALTGSEGAGRSVSMLASKYLKKSTLELGGSDALIVLDDADIDAAVNGAVAGRFFNAGQVCVSAKRIIVCEKVYDEFLTKFKAATKDLVSGDPMDSKTNIAPLSSRSAVDTLEDQVKKAVAGGAKAETLGTPIPDKGFFFQPTLLTDISEDNPIFYEELFGPVAEIFKVKDEKAAIELANNSPFGLGGGVFTKDINRGYKVAAQIETGMVYINDFTQVKADIPFGGVKNSGFGRELTDLGFNEFLNHKVVGHLTNK